MKYLKVLVLLIGLAFSTSVLAQEKEVEKPKEAEKPKEGKLLDVFKPSNEPSHFILPSLTQDSTGKFLSIRSQT